MTSQLYPGIWGELILLANAVCICMLSRAPRKVSQPLPWPQPQPQTTVERWPMPAGPFLSNAQILSKTQIQFASVARSADENASASLPGWLWVPHEIMPKGLTLGETQ